MEAKLFFVSIWCGLYALLLRFVFKKTKWDQQIIWSVLLNGLFWATGSFLAGMLLSSYSDQADQKPVNVVFYLLGGFVVGLFLGFINGKENEKREAMLKDNLEWADTGFSAILLASIVMFFIVQAFKIPSGSMRMTFVEGDHLFVNKFIYGIPVPFTEKKVLPIRKVTPGDIVIFRFPSEDKESPHYGKDFIKRVIATAGHKVQVKNKQVFVDDTELVEPYKQHVDSLVAPGMDYFTPEIFQKKWEAREFSRVFGDEIRDNFGPITVPQDMVFVMGDNRDRSYDARFWGPLPLKLIKGKAWLLYWPLSRFKFVH